MGNVFETIHVTNPNNVHIHTAGNETNNHVVSLAEIVNACNNPSQNPVVKAVKDKFIHMSPIALNFVMEVRTYEDLNDTHTTCSLIQLSAFHPHYMNYRHLKIPYPFKTYLQLINKHDGMDENSIQCILNDEQLTLLRFIQEHGHSERTTGAQIKKIW